MKISASINSPLGKIGIIIQNEKFSHLNFLSDDHEIISEPDQLSKTIITQLDNYFSNAPYQFNFAYDLQGTTFQQKVWDALQHIPHGETLTYGMLAKKLKTSPRAIGQACRTNPIPIIIPCHRIVAAKHLGGYAGETQGKLMEIKEWLLEHEKGGLRCKKRI